jgi:hypothetical protein
MTLRYSDGSPVLEVYTDPKKGYEDPSTQGATFAFNVLRQDGSYVSWMEVEKMANISGVYIRAGGESARVIGLSYAVHQCSDNIEQVFAVQEVSSKRFSMKNGSGVECSQVATRVDSAKLPSSIGVQQGK